MFSHLRAISRRWLVTAAAPALLAVPAVALASEPAAPAAANPADGNPASARFLSFKIYEYYSDASKTTHVGQATRDCEGVYTLESGYATPYYDVHNLPCPS
ncbi:MAG TPA: DUF6289 family protein [Longimicrobium sp.]|nr:DUF6289 family protein [Longimicrobium sp.]